MAKTPMRCPFNAKMCKECQIYRGRHYYLCADEHYRGHINTNQNVNPTQPSPNIDMTAIKRLFEPWSVAPEKAETTGTADTKLKIKVIDREAGTERYCKLDETKNWDWKNTVMMRLVNGKHVTSFEEFAEIVKYQKAKGAEELVVFDSPAFMVA